MLPDRSILKGQKLMESAKIEKLKCDILGDFQTLWAVAAAGVSDNEEATTHNALQWYFILKSVLFSFKTSVGMPFIG